jgi:hypothetical protein
MVLSPECLASPRATMPTIFIVDKFLGSEGSLSQYPSEVISAFKEAFNSNISAINNMVPQRRQLFNIDYKPNTTIEHAPKILGSGDIVLAFYYSPPYKVSQGVLSGKPSDVISDEFLGPEVTTLQNELNKLFLRYADKLKAQWKIIADNPPPRDLDQPSKIELEDSGQSISFQNIGTIKPKTKSGEVIKVFYSIKIGLIDVAFPAAQSTSVWGLQRERLKKLEVLKKAEFAATGVAALGAIPEQGTLYLKAVGRGLAYNLLHEFWHAATLQKAHHIRGNQYIEGSPSPISVNIQFQKASIKNILSIYESTWCNFIKEGRVSLSNLKG